jgi:hypothetical protein
MVKHLAERRGSAFGEAGPASEIIDQTIACKGQKAISPCPGSSTGKSEAGTRNPARREEGGIAATRGHGE